MFRGPLLVKEAQVVVFTVLHSGSGVSRGVPDQGAVFQYQGGASVLLSTVYSWGRELVVWFLIKEQVPDIKEALLSESVSLFRVV